MSSVPTDSVLAAAALASGLVQPAQLDYALRVAKHRRAQLGLNADAPPSDALLAEILIEQELLTYYQATQLAAGRTKLTLGPYLITDFVGQGGMGQVFKAVHRVMGRVCAVKVLPVHRSTPESQTSFMREIRMQAKLDCPYLVRAFDAGQDGSVHYLVTEFVAGMDLRKLVRKNGPLPVSQAASIMMQAALGLNYAHNQGLIHRDVKPGNILVTPEGQAKVSDIGLAGFAQNLLDDPRAGKIVGTADYISPEQIRSPLDVQPVSDIYSLGCTLYYTACGKVPFPGGDTASKLKRHLEETPWHPRKFSPDLPEDFVDIIADMMDKDPQKRIPTAAEVAARLEPWAGSPDTLSVGRLGKSPWQPPPPPTDGDSTSVVETSDEWLSRQDSNSRIRSAATLDGSWPQQETDASHGPIGIPNIHGNPITPPEPTSKTPSGLVIGLTLAVALPPALLIGAIIGFLIHRTFFRS
jgi:serine/threonine protein kinase